MLLGQVAHGAQKGLGSVGKRGLPPMDQPQHAFDLQFVDCDAHQFAGFELWAMVRWGTRATPLPMATKRLMASMVGSSMPIFNGVR